MRDHYSKGQAFGPGFDLKRGRGGIREVEFFAQIHQLIFGGRDETLRSGATLDALAALARAGHVAEDEAAMLGDAYRLYRTVEHRLQMVDDRQTHELPRDPEALDNVARLDGRPDAGALLDELRPCTERVGAVYDRLLVDADHPRFPSDPEAVAGALADLGFPDPAFAAHRVARWRVFDQRALRTPAAQDAFEAVLPELLASFARLAYPQENLVRFESFLDRLPSGVQFFELLKARPAYVALLARLLGIAPTLSMALAARPSLIDGLLDASAFEPAPPVPALVAELGRALPSDYERRLHGIHQRVSERRFALGVQILEGIADPLEVSGGYSRLAEAAIELLATDTVAEFERTQGRVPGGRLIILALGRLGGGAMTASSDLDLVYLFSGAFDAMSEGARPLGATHYFNRLAARVSSALSVPTAAGPLYEVDTRLRPSGTQGLLAVSIDSFEQYQREGAWTWEHMALTRARVIHGSAEDRAAVEAIIGAALHRPRDPVAVVRDAVKMRGEMARHKPPAGALDVKLVAGGLVDLEFTVHALQLSRGVGIRPGLAEALAELVAAGLLPAAVGPAHDLLARLLLTHRLVAPDEYDPDRILPAERGCLVRATGTDDWAGLLAALDDARATVGQCWRAIEAQMVEE